MSYQQHYPAPQQPAPQDSVGSWMLALFLTWIPLVGFIYVLVVAFGGSSSLARRSWARAQLIWMLIGIAITIVAAIIIATTGGLSLSGILNSYSN